MTVEEIWEVEKLAGKTAHPMELMAIQLLVEKKRKEYKEQEWEEWHKENPIHPREFWEQWEWSEPPVGYKALQTVKLIMFDVSPGAEDRPITDWSGNPLDKDFNPINKKNMKFPWFKKKEPVPMKTQFQQMQESGILVIQQETEDKYWDRYIEEQAQKGFEEQINAKILDLGGGRKLRTPILFVPDLPIRTHYTVYDYENPTGRYMHKDPRSLIGERMHKLLTEYDNKKPLE